MSSRRFSAGSRGADDGNGLAASGSKRRGSRTRSGSNSEELSFDVPRRRVSRRSGGAPTSATRALAAASAAIAAPGDEAAPIAYAGKGDNDAGEGMASVSSPRAPASQVPGRRRPSALRRSVSDRGAARHAQYGSNALEHGPDASAGWLNGGGASTGAGAGPSVHSTRRRSSGGASASSTDMEDPSRRGRRSRRDRLSAGESTAPVVSGDGTTGQSTRVVRRGRTGRSNRQQRTASLRGFGLSERELQDESTTSVRLYEARRRSRSRSPARVREEEGHEGDDAWMGLTMAAAARMLARVDAEGGNGGDSLQEQRRNSGRLTDWDVVSPVASVSTPASGVGHSASPGTVASVGVSPGVPARRRALSTRSLTSDTDETGTLQNTDEADIAGGGSPRGSAGVAASNTSLSGNDETVPPVSTSGMPPGSAAGVAATAAPTSPTALVQGCGSPEAVGKSMPATLSRNSSLNQQRLAPLERSNSTKSELGADVVADSPTARSRRREKGDRRRRKADPTGSSKADSKEDIDTAKDEKAYDREKRSPILLHGPAAFPATSPASFSAPRVGSPTPTSASISGQVAGGSNISEQAHNKSSVVPSSLRRRRSKKDLHIDDVDEAATDMAADTGQGQSRRRSIGNVHLVPLEPHTVSDRAAPRPSDPAKDPSPSVALRREVVANGSEASRSSAGEDSSRTPVGERAFHIMSSSPASKTLPSQRTTLSRATTMDHGDGNSAAKSREKRKSLRRAATAHDDVSMSLIVAMQDVHSPGTSAQHRGDSKSSPSSTLHGSALQTTTAVDKDSVSDGTESESDSSGESEPAEWGLRRKPGPLESIAREEQLGRASSATGRKRAKRAMLHRKSKSMRGLAPRADRSTEEKRQSSHSSLPVPLPEYLWIAESSPVVDHVARTWLSRARTSMWEKFFQSWDAAWQDHCETGDEDAEFGPGPDATDDEVAAYWAWYERNWPAYDSYAYDDPAWWSEETWDWSSEWGDGETTDYYGAEGWESAPASYDEWSTWYGSDHHNDGWQYGEQYDGWNSYGQAAEPSQSWSEWHWDEGCAVEEHFARSESATFHGGIQRLSASDDDATGPIVDPSVLNGGEREFIAIGDYAAEDENELSFSEGDVIVVNEIDPTGWYCGRIGSGRHAGRSGWLPGTFVQLAEQSIPSNPAPCIDSTTSTPYDTLTERHAREALRQFENGQWRFNPTTGLWELIGADGSPMPDIARDGAPTTSEDPFSRDTIKQREAELLAVVAASQAEAIKQAEGKTVVRARADFVGEGDGEMRIESGEILELIAEDESGWWHGRSLDGSREGWFPADFVEHLDEVPSASKHSNLAAADSTGAESDDTVEDSAKPARVALVIANQTYAAEDDNELSFSEGDLLEVTQMDSSGWWEGRPHGTAAGDEKWFPSTYVSEVDASSASASVSGSTTYSAAMLSRIVEEDSDEEESPESTRKFSVRASRDSTLHSEDLKQLAVKPSHGKPPVHSSVDPVALRGALAGALVGRAMRSSDTPESGGAFSPSSVDSAHSAGSAASTNVLGADGSSRPTTSESRDSRSSRRGSKRQGRATADPSPRASPLASHQGSPRATGRSPKAARSPQGSTLAGYRGKATAGLSIKPSSPHSFHPTMGDASARSTPPSRFASPLGSPFQSPTAAARLAGGWDAGAFMSPKAGASTKVSPFARAKAAAALEEQENAAGVAKHADTPASGPNQDGAASSGGSPQSQKEGDELVDAPVQLPLVRAVDDFDPQGDSELGLKIGDFVEVLQQDDSGWWRGQLTTTGQTGWFPSTFVEPISDTTGSMGKAILRVAVGDDESRPSTTGSELSHGRALLRESMSRGSDSTAHTSASMGDPLKRFADLLVDANAPVGLAFEIGGTGAKLDKGARRLVRRMRRRSGVGSDLLGLPSAASLRADAADAALEAFARGTADVSSGFARTFAVGADEGGADSTSPPSSPRINDQLGSPIAQQESDVVLDDVGVGGFDGWFFTHSEVAPAPDEGTETSAKQVSKEGNADDVMRTSPVSWMGARRSGSAGSTDGGSAREKVAQMSNWFFGS